MPIKIQELIPKQKKPLRLKKTKYPKNIEAEYYKGLKEIASELKRLTNEYLLPMLERGEVEYTPDAVIDDLVIVFQTIKSAGNVIPAIKLASQMVRGIDRVDYNALVKQVELRFGVDMPAMFAREGIEPILKANIAKNATLIKSIPDEFIKNIETIVYNGVSTGMAYKEIEKQIKGVDGITSVFGKLDNRVKMIARNETSSINGQINKFRMQSVGVNKFEWQTAGDERVRDSHIELDGQVFSWNDLPTNERGEKIAPGEDFNCRCVSIPIFDPFNEIEE